MVCVAVCRGGGRARGGWASGRDLTSPTHWLPFQSAPVGPGPMVKLALLGSEGMLAPAAHHCAVQL